MQEAEKESCAGAQDHGSGRRLCRADPETDSPVCRIAEPEFDTKANAAGRPHISKEGCRVRARVNPTDEEWMMALYIRRYFPVRRYDFDPDRTEPP